MIDFSSSRIVYQRASESGDAETSLAKPNYIPSITRELNVDGCDILVPADTERKAVHGDFHGCEEITPEQQRFAEGVASGKAGERRLVIIPRSRHTVSSTIISRTREMVVMQQLLGGMLENHRQMALAHVDDKSRTGRLLIATRYARAAQQWHSFITKESEDGRIVVDVEKTIPLGIEASKKVIAIVLGLAHHFEAELISFSGHSLGVELASLGAYCFPPRGKLVCDGLYLACAPPMEEFITHAGYLTNRHVPGLVVLRKDDPIHEGILGYSPERVQALIDKYGLKIELNVIDGGHVFPCEHMWEGMKRQSKPASALAMA